MNEQGPRGARLGSPPIYRLYIDEVGNSDLRSSGDPHHRFLALTAIALNRDYVASTLQPAMEGMKEQFFLHDPDDRICLHRKDLMNCRSPFESLKEPARRAAFDAALLKLLAGVEGTIWTVAIDKAAALAQYGERCEDPYHYCLTVLIERYTWWLERKCSLGDVMSEGRGGRENQRLMDAFRAVMDSGTRFVPAAQLQASLTSLELKVRTKRDVITGLQLADLIAAAGFRYARELREGLELQPTFDSLVADAIRSKYDRSPGGRLLGWGIKWLP